MKAQKPAEGILKVNEWGSSKMFKVVCGCGQPDHELNFEVEADDIGVNVNTYVTVKTDYWTETVKPSMGIDNPYLEEVDWAVKSIINSLVRKIKLTWQLWTRGVISTESTITMTGQQALNYAATIEAAIKEVEQARRAR